MMKFVLSVAFTIAIILERFGEATGNGQDCSIDENKFATLRQKFAKLQKLADQYMCKASENAESPVQSSSPKSPEDPCQKNFQSDPERSQKMVVCGLLQSQFGESFTIQNINPSLCSHVYLVDFFTVDPKQDYEIKLSPKATNDFSELMKYLKLNSIKVWLAIGSVDIMQPDQYATMAKSETNRSKFAKNVAEVLEKYEMHGFVQRWLYPVCPWSSCDSKRFDEKKLSLLLMTELSTLLRPKGFLLIGQASSYHMNTLMMQSFGDLKATVDFWLLECSHFQGYWLQQASISTDVRSLKDCATTYSRIVPKSKSIIGVSTVTFPSMLTSSKRTTLGAMLTKKPGPNQMSSVRNVCKAAAEGGLTIVHNETRTPNSYAFKNTTWVSFENTFTIRAKMELIMEKFDPQGIFVEFITADDADGLICNCGKFPILRSVNEEFRGKSQCKLPACPQIATKQ